MNKVIIQFTPNFCTIESNLSEEIHQYLYDSLSFRPTGFMFSNRYTSGGWDGVNHLYSLKTHKFRSGLLSKVVDLLKEKEFDIQINNLPSPTEFNQKSKTYELRPYQLEAVKKILSRLWGGLGIIKAPMRSGKTTIASAVIDSERKFPTVFFVRSLDLLRQTKSVFENLLEGVSVGYIGDGIVDIKDVNVVTIQSAYSSYGEKCDDPGISEEKEIVDKFSVKKLLNSTKQVFVDEVHHLQGKTSRFILEKCVNADLKIGLSGTPFRGVEEDILIERTTGPIIYSVDFSTLIQGGWILKPYIYMYKLPKISVEGTYQSIYKKAIVENDFLTQLIKKVVDRIVSSGESVVVQTDLLNHTKALGKVLSCPTLTGKDSSDYREEMINKLRNKEILCLVSTLFEEGIDVPSLSWTINTVGGLGIVPVFQKMRSITSDNGKKYCGVIDFYHQVKYLKRHSKIRKEMYTSEPEFVFTEIDVSKKSIEEIN